MYRITRLAIASQVQDQQIKLTEHIIILKKHYTNRALKIVNNIHILPNKHLHLHLLAENKLWVYLSVFGGSGLGFVSFTPFSFSVLSVTPFSFSALSLSLSPVFSSALEFMKRGASNPIRSSSSEGNCSGRFRLKNPHYTQTHR